MQLMIMLLVIEEDCVIEEQDLCDVSIYELHFKPLTLNILSDLLL